MAKNAALVKEVERLREKIRHHEYLYYVLDDPEISDAAFDKLMNQLKKTRSGTSEAGDAGFADAAGGRRAARRIPGGPSQDADDQPGQRIFVRGTREFRPPRAGT